MLDFLDENAPDTSAILNGSIVGVLIALGILVAMKFVGCV
jgi:hypothetical protein